MPLGFEVRNGLIVGDSAPVGGDLFEYRNGLSGASGTDQAWFWAVSDLSQGLTPIVSRSEVAR
jgi:hypothetical protein